MGWIDVRSGDGNGRNCLIDTIMWHIPGFLNSNGFCGMTRGTVPLTYVRIKYRRRSVDRREGRQGTLKREVWISATTGRFVPAGHMKEVCRRHARRERVPVLQSVLKRPRVDSSRTKIRSGTQQIGNKLCQRGRTSITQTSKKHDAKMER